MTTRPSSPKFSSTPPVRRTARTPRTPSASDIVRAVAAGTCGSASDGRRVPGPDFPFLPLSDIALAWSASPDLNPHPAFPAFIRTPFPTTPMRETTRLEFLVPIADNEGTPFLDAAFATFEDFLLDLAGGFTFRGQVDGAWRAPDGRVLRDTSRSYVISVPEARANQVATSIDHEVRRRFRQEATFLEQLPTRALAF